MIVSCDIDGVLNNLTECVLQLYNQESGDNLSESDITEYRIERFVKPEYRNKISQYFRQTYLGIDKMGCWMDSKDN